MDVATVHIEVGRENRIAMVNVTSIHNQAEGATCATFKDIGRIGVQGLVAVVFTIMDISAVKQRVILAMRGNHPAGSMDTQHCFPHCCLVLYAAPVI